MKNFLFIIALLNPFSVAVASGLRMGLGNAAAQTGSSLFRTAEDTDRLHATGDTVAESLPSCGESTPYTVSPVAESDIQGIDPLGHVNPSGHTLPSDHIYFYIVPADSMTPTGPRVLADVRSPGAIHITAIKSSEINGNPALLDYGLEFFACRELKSYFSHVTSLSDSLLEKFQAAPQHCTDYSTGGNSFHGCDAQTNVTAAAGEVIGTVGGHTSALDFGSYDYRRTPIAFVSPQRHYGNQLYTVCPLDYFEPTLKAQLEPHLGRWDGGVQRTALPVCGSILYDVANRASGDWYKVGAPDSPEDPHLALIHDNVVPSREELSIGLSVPNVGSTFYIFDPQSSGTHNRDFADISADSNVYCYDSFYDPLGQPAFTNFSLLLTMPTSTTIRIEKLNSASCGSGPWTMGSSYAEFQR